MSGSRTLGGRVVDAVVDRGLLPDPLLRAVVRQLLRRRLAREAADDRAGLDERKQALLDAWSVGPVALSSGTANDQHYEVPSELFELMLGARLKYSSGHWGDGVRTLDEAEDRMLRLTVDRARLADGQDVLELGCGWGSLTLFMAERFPASRITAVSNSPSQREYILKRAAERGIHNVTVLTADVNDFVGDESAWDRVVSVEMFEHVRNHAELLRRIRWWLSPGGELFVHVFAHRDLLYPFDAGGNADWMARTFFTDGVMPSHDLFLRLQDDLVVDRTWVVDGTHYQRTCEAWLERLDGNRDRILQLFADVDGDRAARAWFHRWRVFTIACAELFGFRGGQEWHVSHVRMRSRP